MNTINSRKKGIVLITTMLTVVLVVMLVSTVVFSNLSSMRMTSNFYDKEAALMTANSGVSYALTRLQQDITWKGCGGSTINKAPFWVKEDNGNVTGIVDYGNGKRGVFRIKFNYEDGEGGLDGLSDNKGHEIKSQFVSCNNLTGPTPVKTYCANKDGILETSKTSSASGNTVSKPKDASSQYTVPKFTCDLIVEGFCGRSTQNASLENPFDDNYNATKETVEVYVNLDGEGAGLDSVACAAGNMKSRTKNLYINAASADGKTNVRALKDVDLELKDGTFKMCDGTIYYGNDFKLNTSDKDSLKNERSTDGGNFAKIKWSEVPKADPNGDFIKAGSYIWMKPEGSTCPVLMYYTESYAGKELPKSGGIALTKGEGVVSVDGMYIDPKTMTIMFDRNVYVRGDATKDLVIRSGINEYGTKPIVGFVSKNEGDNKATILSGGGNITIKGVSIGNGSITAEGNINMQGPSMLESDPGVGVSYYSKGDVNIERIYNTTKYAEEQHPTAHEEDVGPIDDENADTAADTDTTDCSTGTVETENANFDQWMNSRAEAYTKEYRNKYGVSDCTYCVQHGNYFCGQQNKFTELGYQALSDAFVQGFASKTSAGVDTHIKCGYCSIHSGNQTVGTNGHIDSCNAGKTLRNMAEEGIKSRINYDLIHNGSNSSETTESNTELSTETDAEKALEGYVDPDTKTENYNEHKAAQLAKLMERYKSINYSDQDISGVIYAWGNININIGDKSRLHLTGSMVAYGGDPQGEPQNYKDKGNIEYKAETVDLNFDPNYLSNMYANKSGRKVKITMYGIY